MKIINIIAILAFTFLFSLNSFASNEIKPKNSKWGFLFYINTENNLADSGNKFYFELLNMIDAGEMKNENDFAIVIKTTNENYSKDKKGFYTILDKPVFKYIMFKNGQKIDLSSSLVAKIGNNPDLSKASVFETIYSDVNEKMFANVDKKFLTFWGHGLGWDPNSLLPSSIRKIEETKNSKGDRVQSLKNDIREGFGIIELRKVLEKFPKVDVISFDQCLMATIEVAYELKDVSNYLIASETTLSSMGLSYISAIKINELSTVDFLKQIVNLSGARLTLDDNLVKQFSLSLIDLSKVKVLTEKLSEFTKKLFQCSAVKEEITDPKTMLDAFLGDENATISYDELYNMFQQIQVESKSHSDGSDSSYSEWNVDIGSFLYTLGNRIGCVKKVAKETYKLYKEVILANSTRYNAQHTGMYIVNHDFSTESVYVPVVKENEIEFLNKNNIKRMKEKIKYNDSKWSYLNSLSFIKESNWMSVIKFRIKMLRDVRLNDPSYLTFRCSWAPYINHEFDPLKTSIYEREFFISSCKKLEKTLNSQDGATYKYDLTPIWE